MPPFEGLTDTESEYKIGSLLNGGDSESPSESFVQLTRKKKISANKERQEIRMIKGLPFLQLFFLGLCFCEKRINKSRADLNRKYFR